MTIPEPTLSDDVIRFPSLDSLRAAHRKLLKDFRANSGTPEVIAKVEQFIRRGKATGVLLDVDADRWAAQSELDYWATQLYKPDYEPPDATLDEFDPQLAPKLDDSLCPYVGLDTFRESDDSVFFGRTRLVGELISKLKNSRFLAVLGSSGSGKSSVVRAGLIPELKKGALPGSAEWKFFPPMVPGSHPLINLARLIMPPEADGAQAEMEAESYRQNPVHLPEVVTQRFNTSVVLMIDQFEEVFTLCTDEVARQHFVDNLIALCQAPKAAHRVILTMRSDFEMNIARLPALQELFERDAVRITPLTAGELREAIEAPAARIGLKFEEGVVNALLSDTLGEPAALPLLQFTLLKLWEKRERNRVTWEAYKKLGGGRQALAHSADRFYNRLIPEEQVTMRRILLKMVRPGEGLEVTSNRVPRASLYQKSEANDRIDRVLERLIKARLVRASEGDMAADNQVEIAHEALVRNWPLLVEWLEQDRVELRQRQRLTAAAEEWQRLNRDPSALWRGVLLEEVHRYDDLNQLEKEFVEAGYEAQQAEMRKLENQAAKLRRLAFYLTAALVMTLIAVFAAINFGNEARASASETSKQLTIAENARISAVYERATAQANAKDAEKQAELALASRLVSQAQLIVETRNSKEMIAVLLAIRSMQISPSVEAAQVLRKNSAATLRASMAHDDQVQSVTFSPDGKYVASASADGTARVWEAATGEEVSRMTHDELVSSVAFSPDGKYVASASADGTARVWEAATGEEVSRMTYDELVSSVAFSPDSNYVVSGGCDQVDENNICVKASTRVWEAATGEEVSRLAHDGFVYSVAFSPDGKYVASGSAGGTSWIWEAATGEEISRIAHDDNVQFVIFSPDGKYLASASYDNTARVWETATGKEISRMTHDGAVGSVSFRPDGKYVASASADGTVRVWAADTPTEEVSRMTHGEAVQSVAFSPDSKYVVSGSRDNTAKVWEAATGKEIAQVVYQSTVSSVAFSPDGKYVASGSWDNSVQVWEASTGHEVARMTHDGIVQSIAFSPDGKYVVSGGCDQAQDNFTCPEGSARVWEAATGKEISRMTYDGYVYSVAFSPDGKYVASASVDGTARVWEASTGHEVARMTHDGPVWSVTFSPDGKYVISGSDDKTARVWEASTGQEVARMTYGDLVYPIAFSPDSKYVVSGSFDSTVRVWTWQPDDSIENACSHLPRNLTRAEWKQYLGDEPYEAICANLPIEQRSQ